MEQKYHSNFDFTEMTQEIKTKGSLAGLFISDT